MADDRRRGKRQGREGQGKLSQENSTPTPTDSDKLATALELLQEILKNSANMNRRYWVYCKVNMAVPLELPAKSVRGIGRGSW